MVEEIKYKIENLSYILNNMLIGGIEKDRYSDILKVSQELDNLICIYTKLTTPQITIK